MSPTDQSPTDQSPTDQGSPDEGSPDEPSGMSSRELLRWYIQKYESAYGRSTLPGSDQLRRLMSPAARLSAKQHATRLLAPLNRRKAEAIAAQRTPLRLHLGCGFNSPEGWVNIDLVGARTDVDWDLRQPLPFADSSVDAVFLEHVFEHMPYSETLRVLANAKRVLRPGGVLRVGVPDAGMYARMYAEAPDRLRTMRWGRATSMLALREVFQEHAHVSAYDAQTLLLVLEEGGFPGAKVCAGGESELLDQTPDMPERWEETVYVEVVRG